MGDIELLHRPGTIAIRGANIDATLHHHHAVQVAIGLGDSLVVETEQHSRRTPAVIIPSDVPHALHADCCLIVLLEPEGSTAGSILDRLGWPREASPLSTPGIGEMAARAASKPLSWPLVDSFLELIGAHVSSTREIDERLSRIVAWIDEIESSGERESLSFAAACDRAALSEGRFRHLLSEQFGISWRRYILWRRLIAAIRFALRHDDMETAALHSGFSDLSHFLRTTRRMFGMTPGEILGRTRGESPPPPVLQR